MVRPALHGAVVLLVVLAGCTGFLQDPPERDERAVAALSDARSALDAVESYRHETDLRVEATGDGRTERVDVRQVGTVDVEAKRMNTTNDVDGRTVESYVVNRTAYQECSRPPGFWGKENQSTEEWETLTPAYRQLSLLESGDLRFAGAATVDGRNATRVVGEPTAEALQRYREERSQPVFGGPEFRDVSMAVWFDNETALPLKTRLRFEVEGRDGSATAMMETRFLAYDEPVSIVVPTEALEDHLEMGCPGS